MQGRRHGRTSKKVKELRKKKGWTQEELARVMEVTLSTIQRWEKQGGQPPRHLRKELIKIFHKAGICNKQG